MWPLSPTDWSPCLPACGWHSFSTNPSIPAHSVSQLMQLTVRENIFLSLAWTFQWWVMEHISLSHAWHHADNCFIFCDDDFVSSYTCQEKYLLECTPDSNLASTSVILKVLLSTNSRSGIWESEMSVWGFAQDLVNQKRWDLAVRWFWFTLTGCLRCTNIISEECCQCFNLLSRLIFFTDTVAIFKCFSNSV